MRKRQRSNNLVGKFFSSRSVRKGEWNIPEIGRNVEENGVNFAGLLYNGRFAIKSVKINKISFSIEIFLAKLNYFSKDANLTKFCPGANNLI